MSAPAPAAVGWTGKRRHKHSLDELFTTCISQPAVYGLQTVNRALHYDHLRPWLHALGKRTGS